MLARDKVLIVDDCPSSLEMLDYILTNADCECYKATNGSEALQLLNKCQEIDVIILDLIMPVMDGFQLIQELKNNPMLALIPVMVVSSDRESVVQVLSMGARDFIAKPFNAEEIALRVQNLALLKRTAEAGINAKSDFLTAVSHDLRTSLGCIFSLVDLLKEMSREPAMTDHLGELTDTISGFTSSLNNMIDYYSFESISRPVPMMPINIQDCIEQAAGALQERIAAKSIKFRLEIMPGTNLNLLGYRDRLRKVFYNILDTSIKFAPAGGTVQVSVSQPDVCEGGYSCWHCTVRDNGIGIDMTDLTEIFLPQNQGTGVGSSLVCQRFGSTGLALVMALRMIRSIGGVITLESEPGYGSSFNITFEATQVAGEQPNEITGSLKLAASDELPPLDILLVEDNPLNQKVAVHLLKKGGHKVELAVNGNEAVNLCQKKRYDMILMDIQMPDMDGYEATRIIRSEEAKTGRHVPIIALTANADADSEFMCHEAGMDSFITKPIMPSDLNFAIRQALLINRNITSTVE